MIILAHNFTHLAVDEEEYLLVQRPSTGLLASFWEFPTVELITNGGKNDEDENEENEAKNNKSRTMVEYNDWKDRMLSFMKNDLKLNILEQRRSIYY